MFKLKLPLPGFVWKKPNQEVLYLKGIVEYVSPRVIYALTESKIPDLQLIPLIGETYIYVCDHCPCTVPERDVIRARQADIDKGMAMPRPKHCLNCGGPIHRVNRGDKVRLHYRFAPDGSAAAWWGERHEW